MMLYGQSEIFQFADLRMLSMIFQLQTLFVMMFHLLKVLIQRKSTLWSEERKDKLPMSAPTSIFNSSMTIAL